MQNITTKQGKKNKISATSAIDNPGIEVFEEGQKKCNGKFWTSRIIDSVQSIFMSSFGTTQKKKKLLEKKIVVKHYILKTVIFHRIIKIFYIFIYFFTLQQSKIFVFKAIHKKVDINYEKILVRQKKKYNNPNVRISPRKYNLSDIIIFLDYITAGQQLK
eukprot:gene12972-8826_t